VLSPPQRLLRIELLGEPRLVRPDGVAHVLERHDAGLLALLSAESALPRLRAARLLWPDAATEKAQNSLRQRLFVLKRIAGCSIVDTGGGAGTLRLSGAVLHDSAEFAGRLVSDSAAGTGEFLGSLDYEDLPEFAAWVDGARAQWLARRGRLLAQTAEQFEGENRFASALPYARRLVGDEPVSEDAHRRVIRLHYRSGDRAAALAAYRHCCTVLAEELGTEPAAETRELAGLVERSGQLDADPAHAARNLRRPLSVLRPPRLVGRDDAWRQAEQAWQRGRLVLVRGEPGVGKTRFASDFARAFADAPVCAARPGDATLPYALLARLLRQLVEHHGPPPQDWVRQELAHLVPELGPAVTLDADALRLRQAVNQALTQWASVPPGALVLDDLQFADAASLETLLDWLAQDPPGPVGRMLTVRSGEVPPALLKWLAAQPRDRLAEIDLEPLGHDALVLLLDSLAVPGLDPSQWAAPLLRHTGGNPMFVLETLIVLLDDNAAVLAAGPAELPAPRGIGRMIERRLGELPPGALRLARVAAIAGLDFDAELAAIVLNCHVLDLSEPWAALEAAQVLRDGAFAHDLIFEAALRLVPQAIAQLIHRDVARELEQRARPAARIAEHWWAAQEWQRAARQFERAAEAAAAQARRDEEMSLLERAAASHEHAGDQPRAFSARLRAAEALVVVGSLAEASAQLERLEPQAVDDAQRVALELQRATFALTGSDAIASEAAAQAAFDLARALGDPAATFDAARLLGSALAVQGRTAAALAMLEEHPPPAGAPLRWRTRCEFHGTFGYVLVMADRRREAVQHLAEAAQLAEQHGDLAEVMTNLTNLAGTLSQLGRVGEALPLLERARLLRVRMGEAEGVGVAVNETVLGLACTALGRYGQAHGVLEAALERFRAAGASTWIGVTEGLLANLYLTLGQRARASRTLTPLADGTPLARRARRLLIEARIEQAGGGKGLDKLRQATALLPETGLLVDRLGVELALAPCLDGAEALTLCRSVAQRAGASELDAITLTAAVREAELLRRDGQAAAAAVLARELSVRIDSCTPYDLYRGEFWWILFGVFDAAGDAPAADAALQAGVAWVRAVLPAVPEVFRDSFMQRNAVNRALLTTNARRRAG
jgi:DNA-binding SARP family transcriptional activator